MKSADIRLSFLEYFKSQGHEAVKSSALMPRNDPSLLFTNAGMVQFKGVFLGEETRPYTRAATSQKCMRAGGKHSDIENVGHTRRHHTFFEMLGNFSFGDYFKRDAIRFAWELLTEVYKLPKDRLWVSVFEDDDDAALIWNSEAGVSRDRIIKLGAKDNFWQMADTGPCGPCSEILVDQGSEKGCGKPDCAPGCDCDRYLEIWNLVFMQFNRDEKGTLTPLPKPSIDTGMGLERISSVMQGADSNFDTDIFAGIISAIETETRARYGSTRETTASIRVIADHVRALSFLMADGLMPSNEGRGYVLRRVLRRASRHARLLGVHGPALYKVAEAVTNAMGDVYPELKDEEERTKKILRFEEERFGRTLEQGVGLLEEIISKVKKSGGDTIPGEEVFRLYDTFGFPLDLARDAANDSDLKLDEAGFTKAMEAQREKARASWVGEEKAVSAVYPKLHAEIGDTEFTGYEETWDDGCSVTAMLVKGKPVNEIQEGEEGEIFLDVSPFYAESGGQSGDTGAMTSEGAKLDILDTLKPYAGMHAHKARVRHGVLRKGDKVLAEADSERRRATMRNHTATHLLQSALRSVLGEHVKQSGSFVNPERLRFDFSHYAGLSQDETDSIEDIVNEKVLENIPVETDVLPVSEALSSGALAFFGEKYGDAVRVVSVKGASKEFCGGTHCRATGDIGLFKLVSEGSVASGIRRIEAVTGKKAFEHLRAKEAELKEISRLLKSPESASERLKSLLEEMRGLQKEMEKHAGAKARDLAGDLVKSAKEINGIKTVSAKVEGIASKDLRVLADSVRDKIGSGVIVLASVEEGQAAILAAVTKDLVKTVSAGNILKEVAALAGGRGGGKPDMAQGGTKEIGKLDSALEKVYDIIRSVKRS